MRQILYQRATSSILCTILPFWRPRGLTHWKCIKVTLVLFTSAWFSHLLILKVISFPDIYPYPATLEQKPGSRRLRWHSRPLFFHWVPVRHTDLGVQWFWKSPSIDTLWAPTMPSLGFFSRSGWSLNARFHRRLWKGLLSGIHQLPAVSPVLFCGSFSTPISTVALLRSFLICFMFLTRS